MELSTTVENMADKSKYLENQKTVEGTSMSRVRILKNLMVVCFGFFFLYLPFESLASIQSTIYAENDLSLISQTVIYATIILSALLLPKFVIKKCGCKYTLVFCILTFLPHLVANFYPHMATFIPTAILLGIGNAPLWAAKCTYVNEISVLYSAHISDTPDVITSKFFGAFYSVFQSIQIWGNLMSFAVLKPRGVEESKDGSFTRNSALQPLGKSFYPNNNFSCGAEYSGGVNENLLPPPAEKRYMLIGIYVGSAFLSALIVFLFLDPLKQHTNNLQAKETTFSRAADTLKHLRIPDQLLLVPLTIFNGIEQAFIVVDFSQAFVACAWGLYNVGLVFICFGVVNSTMSFLAGNLVKYIPRMVLMLTGAAGNVAVCTVLLLWMPNGDEFIYFFILVGLWGFSDAIWMTQIQSLYGVLFRGEEEVAFANFKLWESLGFSLAFGYSIFLNVPEAIYTLLTFLILGISGYIIVEIRNCTRKESYSGEKPRKRRESC